jgi:hypothetical protein
MKMEFMANVDNQIAILEHSDDLRDYAAKAVLRELADSWRDAMRDGTPPSECLIDFMLIRLTHTNVEAY